MKKNFIYLLLLFSLIAQAQVTPSYPTIKLTKTVEGVKQDSLLVVGTDKIVKHIPASTLGTVKSVTGIDGVTVSNGTTNPIIGITSISQLKVAGLVTDLSNKVDKVTGKSLVLDSEIIRLAGVTNQDISGKENISNKQNSLSIDATNLKYPTVTAVNNGLNLKANDVEVLHKTGNEEFTGVKKSFNSLANKSGIIVLTTVDATSAGISTSTSSTTAPGLTAYSTNGTAIKVEPFGINTKGIYIEPNQTNPTAGNMLILSNKKIAGGAIDISTPLSVQRDDVEVSKIDDFGNNTSKSFIKTGGTSSQFLKADGSVDSNIYANDSNVIHKTGNETKSGILTLSDVLKLTGNTTSATATKVNVQEADGTINTISKSDLVNVVEVNDVPSLPLIGEASKIYVVKNLNKIYRWNGTIYQELAVTDISGKINVSEKGVTVATLEGGKIPNSQIPALAISETFPVSSQAQMLALSQADQGDVAIRSDISKSFILRVSPSSVLANWSELLSPTDAVTSVAGKVGAVTLNASDIGGLQTALNLKENTFSKNTAFNKNFGTAAGTVADGAYSPSKTGTGATGTWGINISGNSSNSTLWNSQVFLDSELNSEANSYVMGFSTAFNSWHPVKKSALGTFLDLGSNAYTSTVIPTNTNQLINGAGYITDISGKFDKTGGTISGNTSVTGTVTASGGFFNSDLRLKNIFKRDGDVAYYTWKDGRDDKKHIGYVAQSVQKTHPDQVQADEKGILSVNYVEILVEKIRVLEKRIEQLEKSK